MTKAELVKLLNENFKDDEEVTFLHYDDGMESRAEVTGVHDHTETHIERHFEYLKDGKWVRWNEENDEMKSRCHITDWWHIDHDKVKKWWKEVVDGYRLDTRKVVEIE